MNHKFGFLGAGNMNQAILGALIDSKTLSRSQIWVSNRTDGKLKKVSEQFGVQIAKTNEELVDQCDIIVVGVKPQDIMGTLEQIANSFTESHTLISLAAGVPISALKKLLPKTPLIRVMPNTAVRIKKGVIGYCVSQKDRGLQLLVERIFSPVGYVVEVEEGEEFEALTVSCSSGIGFVYELMMYWQEWLEEHGFAPETAREMTLATFAGASKLAEETDTLTFEELQSKVTSKKGVTAAGLDSMREFEVERGLRYSFEKAVLRDRELGKTSV